MKRLIGLLAVAWLVSVPAAFCDQINIGDVFYVLNTNDTTQFFLDNFTGTVDGCSTPSGFPVCTDLLISGTLTYSYSTDSGIVDGTATLVAPIGTDDANGGSSYAPANFLLPTTATSIILSASFSGFLTPLSFITDTGSFNSDGTVVSSDVVAGGGFALLSATSASGVVPEPTSLSLLMFGSVALAIRFRRLRRTSVSLK
jgi:hypothetical protein